MRNQADLVGKTISGIISAPGTDNQPDKIWMLQFTDGTHVEFVSPGAQRALERFSRTRKRVKNGSSEVALNDVQLALNVA